MVSSGMALKSKSLGSIVALIVILVFFLPALAVGQASFYRWTGRSGRVHVVDHIDKVPREYRSQATKITGRRSESKTPPMQPSSPYGPQSGQLPTSPGPDLAPSNPAPASFTTRTPSTPEGGVATNPRTAPLPQASPPAPLPSEPPPELPPEPVPVLQRPSPAPTPVVATAPPETAAESPSPPAAPRRPFTFSDLYDSYVQSALWLLVPVLLFPIVFGGIASYLKRKGHLQASRSAASFVLGFGVAAVFVELLVIGYAWTMMRSEVLSRVDILAAGYPIYLLVAGVTAASRVHSLRDLEISRRIAGAVILALVVGFLYWLLSTIRIYFLMFMPLRPYHLLIFALIVVGLGYYGYRKMLPRKPPRI